MVEPGRAGRPYTVFDRAEQDLVRKLFIAGQAGRLVRVFFANAGPNLASTFHVNGTIFTTVYRGGNPADAMLDLSSFEVGPGGGAVFEFRAQQPGDYQFLDQAMAHPYKGAIGVFRAAP